MDEHQPVDDGEHVYRRIHRAFFQPGLPVPVSPAAFRPNQNDTTGLSVFRDSFVKPADTLAGVDTSKQNEYYIARLEVRELRKLGLSVVPEPDPNGPLGHAVMPELNWQAYQANKQLLKQIQVELARLASNNIVHQPSQASAAVLARTALFAQYAFC